MLKNQTFVSMLAKEIEKKNNLLKNQPEYKEIRQMKKDLKTAKKLLQSAVEQHNGALEIALADFEPALPIFEKIKKLEERN